MIWINGETVALVQENIIESKLVFLKKDNLRLIGVDEVNNNEVENRLRGLNFSPSDKKLVLEDL